LEDSFLFKLRKNYKEKRKEWIDDTWIKNTSWILWESKG
jgi:hypothetical protein